MKSGITHSVGRALEDSEFRLQQVLDASSSIVYAKDRGGRYLFVNREFERATGRASAEVLGRTDDEVFPPSVACRFRHNDLRVLHERRTLEFEETADFGSGPRSFISSKFPLLDTDGVVYAVCGMSTDITERKHLEEAFSTAALAVSQAEEEALYRHLVRYLATILHTDCAFVATTAPDQPDRMVMRAFFLDGDIRENFAYPLDGTPCETVVGQQFRIYPSGLAERFPQDADFQKLGLVAYAGHPLSDANGRTLGLISVVSRQPFRDLALVEATLRIFAVRVTAELERAAAAAALRASEASYRAIFEASEDAIFVHDWDTGAIVDANPRACEIYGYTREELMQSDVRQLSSGEEPFTGDAARAWIERAKTDGAASFEWRRRNKDGTLHWDEVRLKRAEIGGHRRVLAFTREITERKAAEEALRASEARYRAIFNASADAMTLWNQALTRVDTNPAYERLFGWCREEVVGRGFEFPAFSPDHRWQREQLVRRALHGEALHGEHDVVCKDGRTIRAEVQAVPFAHDGQPHALIIARDITERRRAEQERIGLEAQLRQAQKMEAIGQLTGGIAHDFNNLLTSIMGYVALAGDHEGSRAHPRLQGYLTHAMRSCERARDLIQQMLLFSRGHAGSPRAISLSSLVQSALATLRAGLPDTLELSTDTDPSVPPVMVDPRQVEQVLLNLCINARDATDASGRVRIAVRTAHVAGLTCAGCRNSLQGQAVELVVEDDGHGIEAELVERIFEPFFSTKEAGKGSGMGLAMVHGIVHEYGGHVVVESSPGHGARFRVAFPVMADAPTDDEQAEPDVQPHRRPSLSGRVLVVDDEESVAEYMRDLLGTWGMQATCANSPEVALELLRANPQGFDVVITDQSMPRMTGLVLSRRMRDLRRDLPVILYTGFGDGLDGTAVEAAQLRAVIRKPVDPASLAAVLAECLPAAKGISVPSG